MTCRETTGPFSQRGDEDDAHGLSSPPCAQSCGLPEGKSAQKWTHSLNLFISIPLSPPLQVSYLEPVARNGRKPTMAAKIESGVAEEEWGFWGSLCLKWLSESPECLPSRSTPRQTRGLPGQPGETANQREV